MPLIDPGRVTPRSWLIIGVVLIVGIWLWHEFIAKLGRLVDKLCERADVLQMDKANGDVRSALD